MTPTKLAPLAAVLALSLGCLAEPASAELASKSDPLLTDMFSFFLGSGYKLSFDLVSHGLNGQTWNGKTLDGHAVVSVSLQDVALGARTESLRLAGTDFKPAKAAGPSGGRSVVGARFTATLDDGDTLALRVEDVVAGAGRDRDVNHYLVTYETAGGYRSFCGNDASGAPIRAIPLAGRWDFRAGVAGGGGHVDDPTAFTFACDGKVLAECVTMGYKPWVTGQLCDGNKGTGVCRAVAIADYHQACTRMLRADYCGDGLSHTVDGTVVNSYDALGIRTPSEPFAFEAEWTPSGARCAARQRIAGAAPSCWASLQQASCGADAHFLDGTLLMSGVTP